MQKFISLLLLQLSMNAIGFSKTWTVNNSGFTFTPANITITIGDDVDFVLSSSHNAREVSESTWDANGNTPLPGGFETPFGGGLVPSSKLPIGTHWYVCSAHFSMGMKGIIEVNDATGTNEDKFYPEISMYPNPVNDLLVINISNQLVGSPYCITDQSGKQILIGKLSDQPSLVDLKQLTSGLYFLQILDPRRQSYKIVKN